MAESLYFNPAIPNKSSMMRHYMDTLDMYRIFLMFYSNRKFKFQKQLFFNLYVNKEWIGWSKSIPLPSAVQWFDKSFIKSNYYDLM
jgi:hypothetical protein